MPEAEPGHRPDAPEPIETASRDEIEALQLRRLRAAVTRMYDHSPFYRQRLDRAGLHPADLGCLADLAAFPLTDKADLRQNYPFGMFAVPRDRIRRIHASSGTTGAPTVVGYTAGDLDMWAGLVARCLRAAGVRPGDLVHNAYGYGLYTGGLGLHGGAERLGCPLVPASVGLTARQVRLIRDFHPRVITATPSYMLTLADEFRRQGVDPADSALAIGIHGAEPWSAAMRREIETTFALRAVDIYGLSEVLGPGVAVACPADPERLQIWEDHFYPEIIDPVSGEVLPDGTPGELVLTPLTREASPLLRYRTRDLSCLSPGAARAMRRMARIVGRSDDMLVIRGVNLFPSQVEELLLADPRLAPQYRLELRRPERLDELTVVVEAAPEHAGAETRAAAARDLGERIRAGIGILSRVRVVAPGSVKRSAGKAERVVDLRDGQG